MILLSKKLDLELETKYTVFFEPSKRKYRPSKGPFPAPIAYINGEKGRLVKYNIRLVYKFSDVYLKLDGDMNIFPDKAYSFDDKFIENHSKKQLQCWEDNKNTTMGQYLCPIVADGKYKNLTWIIQVKCEKPIKSRDVNILFHAADKMGIEDMYNFQMGYYKGKPVIIDYGLYYPPH